MALVKMLFTWLCVLLTYEHVFAFKILSFEACDSDPEGRVDCGFNGITQEQCDERECCWVEEAPSGSPPCYQSNRNICGRPAIPPTILSRVIGGDTAKPHSWPWAVSLQRNGWHYCGGSLVNERWVLSAAHCSGGVTINSEDSLVVLGAHNISDDESTMVKVMVDQVITHERFRMCILADDVFAGTENDVMLIRLAEPVQFNDVISPICLAERFPTPGKRCYAIGWGMDAFDPIGDEYSSPELLQQFMAPIIDSELCNSTEWYNGRINPTTMCAGYEEGGRSNCYGDSGGPLMCRENGSWQQVGVVSWGEVCAGVRTPGVYAEVSQQVKWVEDQIAKYDHLSF